MIALAGIDVSAIGQGVHFNWGAWRGKIAFAGIKISEGTGFADPAARANIAGARSIGAVPMGYHMLLNGTGSQGGPQQAEWFLHCAEQAGLKPHDLIAVDVEDYGLGDVDRSNALDVEQSLIHFDLVAGQFAGELRKHFRNFNPVVYTEMSIAPHLESMAACPLWLADLTVPLLAGIGPWKLVSFWQTGQRGVDTDVFNGSAADLAKLGFTK
jgi:GH25 family lysozyme M1 (1,4-beta-N-acetylmuramidase)